ncbi:Oidioi.mRNA.OKI2018_I69.chr2.g7280.t2.cds [Oikopleura dioica]|uniref:Oidioi.mRNA.OKI2018_I69.chr2.g7280.t2.cds n=1 Tax=Oikopleura dioica TaxID=34765 RepID=A0ABN7T6A8_OIKDI|nr:Oidioi.mRNA.OKI2018_I69.chr2.g7280.t2.cds [Oikopleura dioica]
MIFAGVPQSDFAVFKTRTMMESEKVTPFGDISNTVPRKEKREQAPIKIGPGGDNNENDKENEGNSKQKVFKKKTRGTRGGRKNREKIARTFEKNFSSKTLPKLKIDAPMKLDISLSSATESEKSYKYSVEELISFRKSSIAKSEPKFLCECPLTKKKSGLEEVKILPVPYQQDGTIGNIIAKILNRDAIEPIKGDLPHFVRRTSISPSKVEARTEMDKPSVCKRSESRESFIREDAPRKHKMRPPTAQAFQPYEVAEDYDIGYNQNYEYDPNVEYCPMPVYYYVPYFVPAVPVYAETPTMSNSSSLSSIFSRSESIPEFIPNSARSAPPTPKEDDEPLATPLEDSLDEIEEEEEIKEEAKEEQEKV